MLKTKHLPVVMFVAIASIIIQSQETFASLSLKQVTSNSSPTIDIALSAEDYNREDQQKIERENYQGAIADFNKAIELDPQLADVYYAKGNIYRILGDRILGDYSQAKRDLEKAFNLPEENDSLWYSDAIKKLNQLVTSQNTKQTDIVPAAFNASKEKMYQKLEEYLRDGDFSKADQQTWELMKQVGNGGTESFFFPEQLDNFSCTDLNKIDQLWVKYSNGKYGFSVQKEIWENVGGTLEVINYGNDNFWPTVKKFDHELGGLLQLEETGDLKQTEMLPNLRSLWEMCGDLDLTIKFIFYRGCF